MEYTTWRNIYPHRRGNLPAVGIVFALFLSTLLTFGCSPDKIPPHLIIPEPADTLFLTRIISPSTQHLNVIRSIGNTLYLAGDDGYMYRGDPTSGFHSSQLPENIAVWDILDYNNTTFVFGELGTIYRSENGSDWAVAMQGAAGQQFHQSHVDGGSRIWALGTNIGPYVSADNGVTWVLYERFGGTSVTGFYSIAFHPTSHRGYISTSTQTFRTYDNGTTWNGPMGIEAQPNDILFISDNEMLAACTDGTILRSYNFGAIWERANIPALVNENINRVLEVPGEGWIAISSFFVNGDQRHGRAWQSFDKQDWFMIADIDWELRDIVTDPTLGTFVCGSDGYLGKLSH